MVGQKEAWENVEMDNWINLGGDLEIQAFDIGRNASLGYKMHYKTGRAVNEMSCPTPHPIPHPQNIYLLQNGTILLYYIYVLLYSTVAGEDNWRAEAQKQGSVHPTL